MRKWREELLTFNSNQTMTVTTTEPTVAQPAPLLPIVSAPEKKPIIENNDKKRIAMLEGTPGHACGEIYRFREFQSSNSNAGPASVG
jgi:hypothetical protein